MTTNHAGAIKPLVLSLFPPSFHRDDPRPALGFVSLSPLAGAETAVAASPRTESCPLPWGHEGQIPGSGGSGGKGGGAGDRGGNRDMEGWEQQVREEQGEEGSRISAGEDPAGR